jgi:hypothetical protein
MSQPGAEEKPDGRCGAGPAGLAAAIRLEQKNASIAVKRDVIPAKAGIHPDLLQRAPYLPASKKAGPAEWLGINYSGPAERLVAGGPQKRQCLR